MKSSGWASVGGEGAEDGSRAQAGARPLKKLEDEVAEKMIEDEGLLVSRQDEVRWHRASSGELNLLTALLTVDDGNALRMDSRRDRGLGTVSVRCGVTLESRLYFLNALLRAIAV